MESHKRKPSAQPPKHLFVAADETVYCIDAVVAWTFFYNKTPNTKLSKKKKNIDVLALIEKAEFGSIHYLRWSKKEKKYQSYCANGKHAS